ncbi:MAG: hypothetical protein AB7S38_21710 [Vulcanimicrobiota bacterium]
MMELPDWIKQGADGSEIWLDPMTELESYLARAGCLGLIAPLALLAAHGVGATPWLQTHHLLGFFMVGLALWLFRAALEDHYTLHLDERKLYFERTFLGRRQKAEECGFEGLAGLAVACLTEEKERGSPLYYYALLLVLNDGRTLPIGPTHRRDFNGTVRAGQNLAMRAGLNFFVPEKQKQLHVLTDAAGVTVEYRRLPYW